MSSVVNVVVTDWTTLRSKVTTDLRNSDSYAFCANDLRLINQQRASVIHHSATMKRKSASQNTSQYKTHHRSMQTTNNIALTGQMTEQQHKCTQYCGFQGEWMEQG